MLRERCVLITFPSATAALRMESEAAAAGLPGRLVPLPGAAKAGCGLAWSAPLWDRERLVLFLREEGLSFEKMLEAVL